jgi:hypothetical protein
VEFAVSLDGRLFVERAAIETDDPYSLLVELPPDQPSLIRIQSKAAKGGATALDFGPQTFDSTLEFTAFLSREEPVATPSPYRESVTLPGQATRLWRTGEAASHSVWALPLDAGVEFPIQGPARLQLVVWLRWPRSEPRHEQPVGLRVGLDGAGSFPLWLSLEVDARHPARIDGSSDLVSERMAGFFTVPEGSHRVRLEADVPVYLAVFRLAWPDFFLPGPNGPSSDVGLDSSWEQFLNAPGVGLKSLSPQWSAEDLVAGEQQAWQLARDNQPLDAGAQAGDWLKRLARSWPDYPPARRSAEKLWRQRTVYREVLPGLPEGRFMQKALFAPGCLRPLFAPKEPVAVWNPTLAQAGRLFSEGHFAPVPLMRSPGLHYELPERSHDSELRIAALSAGTHRSRLLVQFDQETPFRVSLEPVAALPVNEFEASEAFATLRVLEQEVKLPLEVVRRHSIGEFDLPSPISAPGVLELPLPQHVRQVRVFLPDADASVLTSVAYRAAKPFEFGEAGYLALLERVGSAAAMKAFGSAQGELAEDSLNSQGQPLHEIRNHLLPLSRRLNAHLSNFTNNFEWASSAARAVPHLSPGESAALKDSALSLERLAREPNRQPAEAGENAASLGEGQFLEAIAVWNRLFWEGTAQERLEAAEAIGGCLQSVGEDFLARQYARYALLCTPSSAFRKGGARNLDLTLQTSGSFDRAVALLENAARQDADPEQLEELHAFLFLHCPCSRHLAGLTEALVGNGQFELALWAGLILPPEFQPAETLLQAALQENWWCTFDRLVDGLKEETVRRFWRAQKQLAFHQFLEAEQELKLSGDTGRELLQALQAGLRIRERLLAPSRHERLDALLAWEQWQSRQPGPKTWQSAKDVNLAWSAAEMLFNCEQNRFIAYPRAEPGKPVRLRFLGPLRLQLEARPILGLPLGEALNDWLEVVELGMTNRIPVSHCVPSPSLQFAAGRNALPGVKTVAQLDFGPGWHEVEVALARHPALIRVSQEQPVLPLRILPGLNAHRLNLVLQTSGEKVRARRQAAVKNHAGLWWVPAELAHPSDIADQVNLPSSHAVPEVETGESNHLTAVNELRLALRRESVSERPFSYDSRLLPELPPAEQWLAAGRTRRWEEIADWTALPDSARVSRWIGAGQIEELLAAEIPRSVDERLASLLEVSELFPAWREPAQCLAEFLAAQAHCTSSGRKILSRLTHNRVWSTLAVSPLSAGMKPVQVLSDTPQEPSLRLRRALLPPARTNQFTISGQSVFEAAMVLHHPARVQLQADLVKAGFSPALPLSIAVEVDAGQVFRLPFPLPGSAIETNLLLSAGPHRVRVWIADPAANQFVRIAFSGKSEETTNSLWRPDASGLAEVASERRFLHAATRSQPVRFSLRGPALLRVDEHRDGRFVSRLHLVQTGEETVELPPSPGRAESWYQVFVRGTQTNQLEIRTASQVREAEEVPAPRLRLPETPAISEVRLTDFYRLGGQEDGTWTPGLWFVHRRPFELSPSQNVVENEFIEANVTYRKANPSETLYFRTQALGRWHRPGDLTFGLSERVEGHPQTSPFDWSWLGEAFVGTVGPDQEDVQYALHTDLELGERFHFSRKLDWYPFASLFAHYLSLDPSTASQYDYLDQDLYTSYRQEHRWGGVLGSRLEYRPRLDALLKGGVHLMSNEDFTLDSWGMQVSWTQLMGPLWGEVAYRLKNFLDDADRSSAAWLQGASVGLFAEGWIRGRHRVEFGAQFRHDWPDSGNSYFFMLKWDFSQGRRYQDYGRHELTFRELRSRRVQVSGLKSGVSGLQSRVAKSSATTLDSRLQTLDSYQNSSP